MGSCNWRALRLSQYFTEKTLDLILRNLGRAALDGVPLGGTDMQDDANAEQPFPSVCLIGLGRCGSNIALDVASLVYNARQFYSNEFEHEEASKSPVVETERQPKNWIRRNLARTQSRVSKPVFLIEPMVMLGDLDKDIKGRILFSRAGAETAASSATTTR